MTWNTGWGGSTTPAGSNQEVQYNNNGALAGASGLSWTGTFLRGFLKPFHAQVNALADEGYAQYYDDAGGANPNFQILGRGYLQWADPSSYSIDTGLQRSAAGVVTIDDGAGGNARLVVHDITVGGVAYVWPTADGAANDVLQTDGSGNLSWAASSSTSPGGTSGQLQYNNAPAFGGTSGLTWNGSRLTQSQATNTVAFSLEAPALTAAGTQLGLVQRYRANSYNTSNHTVDWLVQARSTSQAGAGKLSWLYALDGAVATERMSIDSTGILDGITGISVSTTTSPAITVDLGTGTGTGISVYGNSQGYITSLYANGSGGLSFIRKGSVNAGTSNISGDTSLSLKAGLTTSIVLDSSSIQLGTASLSVQFLATKGIGNGTPTNLTAPAKSTGTGPASMAAVSWIPMIDSAGAAGWVPMFQ